MRTTWITATLLCQALNVYAAPTITTTSIDVENVTSRMTYTGPITPGGAIVTLYGTAQEIHNQILDLEPKFNPMDFAVVREAYSNLLTRNIADAQEKFEIDQYIAKREMPFDGLYYGRFTGAPNGPLNFQNSCCRCTPPPYDAYARSTRFTRAMQGPISYLIGLPGTCGVDPDGIVRVSCAYDAGVWIMNFKQRDGVQIRNDPPCQEVGEYARNIDDMCTETFTFERKTNGQQVNIHGEYLVYIGRPREGC